jgi:CheY-like chemotaxis protein
MTKKVFIVDDEVSFTRMLKANLERTGRYSVVTENDPMVAREAAKSFEPDVMFLDVMMPGMEGGELAALMREDKTLAAVPIVFMTAIVTKEETGDSIGEIGGNMFLAKPVKLQDVLDAIQKVTS